MVFIGDYLIKIIREENIHENQKMMKNYYPNRILIRRSNEFHIE